MVPPEDAVILLIDNSLEDVHAIKRGLTRANLHNRLLIMRDTEEALAYLRGYGEHSDRERHPLPNLILVRLDRRGDGGFTVLEGVRNNPQCRLIRSIALIASDEAGIVNRAYDAGASACVIAPADSEGYETLLRSIGSYWLRRNAMPSIEEEESFC